VIGFVTRPSAPPSPETLKLVDGVIAGGPLIKLTSPAPWLQASRLPSPRHALTIRSRAARWPRAWVWDLS